MIDKINIIWQMCDLKLFKVYCTWYMRFYSLLENICSNIVDILINFQQIIEHVVTWLHIFSLISKKNSNKHGYKFSLTLLTFLGLKNNANYYVQNKTKTCKVIFEKNVHFTSKHRRLSVIIFHRKHNNHVLVQWRASNYFKFHNETHNRYL